MSANDVGCRSFFIQPLRENKNNIFWSDYQLIFFLEGKETKKNSEGQPVWNTMNRYLWFAGEMIIQDYYWFNIR